MSEPAHVPQPGDYRWLYQRDREGDTTALITAALAEDIGAAAQVLGSLERAELITLYFTVASWYADLARREMLLDSLVALREKALERDRLDSEGFGC